MSKLDFSKLSRQRDRGPESKVHRNGKRRLAVEYIGRRISCELPVGKRPSFSFRVTPPLDAFVYISTQLPQRLVGNPRTHSQAVHAEAVAASVFSVMDATNFERWGR